MFTQFTRNLLATGRFSRSTINDQLFNKATTVMRAWHHTDSLKPTPESTIKNDEEQPRSRAKNSNYKTIIASFITGSAMTAIFSSAFSATVDSEIAKRKEAQELIESARLSFKEQKKNTRNILKNAYKNIERYQSWIRLSYSNNETEINKLRDDIMDLDLGLNDIKESIEYLKNTSRDILKKSFRQKLASPLIGSSQIDHFSKELNSFIKDLGEQKELLEMAKYLNSSLLHLKALNHQDALKTIEKLELEETKYDENKRKDIIKELLNNSLLEIPVTSPSRASSITSDGQFFSQKLIVAAYNLKGMILDDDNDRSSKKQQEISEQALDNLLYAVRLDRTNAYIWSNIGFILEQIPNFKEKSIEFHKKAYQLNSDSPSILNGYARRLYLQENPSQQDILKALKLFDRALSLEPKNIALFRNKGHLLLNARKLEEAKECLVKALDIDPDDLETLQYSEELNVHQRKNVAKSRWR